MSLSIIAAMTEERVIGYQNKLPWHLSEDLKHFKKITTGHPVIMGRKTYESIGKLLPGRENVIVTRNSKYQVKGAHVVHSLEEAIALLSSRAERGISPLLNKGQDFSHSFGMTSKGKEKEIFIIGGAEIFREALPKANQLYLTIIHKRFDGDAYFPEFNLEEDFKIIEKSTHRSSGGDPLFYTFITAERQ